MPRAAESASMMGYTGGAGGIGYDIRSINPSAGLDFGAGIDNTLRR